MPELPEVETMRRGVFPVIGATIVAAERTPSPRRPIKIQPSIKLLHRRVAGQKIQAVERVGKRVALRLTSGDRLIFEPRMTGLVLIDQPPTQEHLRFRLRLRGRRVKELLYWDRRGLGSVYLLRESEYQEKLFTGKLGPDALAISSDEFHERFSARKKAIKVALLDQALVAGVGNLYASEILHRAGVHPAVLCHRLSRAQYDRIFETMRIVLDEAIESEGSTLSDGTYRNALNQSGGFQNQHRVYDRAGSPCLTCRSATIIRIVQSQRATFFCPACQTRR